jgi:L-ascorbate metabolism protein UlaG (beta-lactamase superfamily)
MSLSQRILSSLLYFPVAAYSWLRYLVTRRNSLEHWRYLELEAAPKTPHQLRVTFLGVSTLLFDDGDTAILIDGFFTRYGRLRTLFKKIGPNPDLIKNCLACAEVKNLKAVIVLHSHHDHSLDAPEVAAQTGAELLGSESTANIARGYIESGCKLPKESIKLIESEPSHSYGRFRITWRKSAHSPLTLLTHFCIHKVLLDADINAPLRQPAWWTEFKEGGSYSLLIEHDGRKMLVQGSAGLDEEALNGVSADVVFLGVGTLGKLDDRYRETYWRQLVEKVGAHRVIPIHWDDFFRPLADPLVPSAGLVDDFDKTMNFLLARAGNRVEVRLMREWTATDPFTGLGNLTGQ